MPISMMFITVGASLMWGAERLANLHGQASPDHGKFCASPGIRAIEVTLRMTRQLVIQVFANQDQLLYLLRIL